MYPPDMLWFNLLQQPVTRQSSEKHIRLLLDYFADRVDESIQDALIAELTARYAEVSAQLQEYAESLKSLVEEKVQEVVTSQTAAVYAIVKLAESRDDDTGRHIERTSEYCRLLAQKAMETPLFNGRIDDAFVQNIALASPLHDIGKVGIPDAILLKPGRLTTEEFEIIKTHVTIGYETLAAASKMNPGNSILFVGMDIARYHHERWDGGGYQDGLKEGEIPLSARIMTIGDVYDALRSKRAYKAPFSHETSVRLIMEERGTRFDPVLADLFFAHNDEFREIFDRSVDTQN